nr:LbtU family siderophore porin [Pseudomonadota bacterium]
MFKTQSILFVATMLLPFSGWAHASNETQRQIDTLREQNAQLNHQNKQLNGRVNTLSAKVDALAPQPLRVTTLKQEPVCCDANEVRHNAFYIKNVYPDFYDIITQNSPKSNLTSNCNCVGIFCFSVLGNIDFNYSDHDGDPFNANLDGVGVRPMFGPYSKNFQGGITDLDLFVDMAINSWVHGHVDLAYINASIITKTTAREDIDWSTAYRNGGALKVNQAYFMLANPACTPLYIQLGRFNSTFGDYESFPMTRSLTQLLEEQRGGGINVGAIFDNGFYASANWTLSRQSLDNYTGENDSLYFGTNRDRNYGGKLGFKGPVSNSIQFAADVSYTADIRDSDYLESGYDLYNNDLRTAPFINFLLENSFVRMVRTPGVAAHVGVDICNVGLYANYVTALNALNPGDIDNSKIWAFDVNANVKFPVCNHAVKLEASYQRAGHTNVYYTYTPIDQVPVLVPGFPLEVGNILPEDRLVGSVWFNVMRHVTIAAQWVHD